MPRKFWRMPAMVLVTLTLSAPSVHATEPASVVSAYADMALAVYQDSLGTARNLQRSIGRLLEAPGAQSHDAAKAAWKAARVPYQQSEVFRFGNQVVDEWEGRVNAWPLDEGLIDYVAASYGADSESNAWYAANIVASPELRVAGRTFDFRTIDANALRTLHEVDDVEANVATGYHAIEFLLWGQDLNGTGPGAGARPWSDFARGDACTGGNCERRRDYLVAATQLLIDDLAEMVAAWGPSGSAREALAKAPPEQGLVAILTGMGSLSYGELAGERMRLGLMLHDPEEEHDCFSDNTHHSHYFDALGVRNVYLGRYVRSDGSTLEGASLSELVRQVDSATDRALRNRLDHTMQAMTRLVDTAENGVMAYDQMIGEGNNEGNAIVQAAVDALVAQTRDIENAARVLGIESLSVEGSESLDNPGAIFK